MQNLIKKTVLKYITKYSSNDSNIEVKSTIISLWLGNLIYQIHRLASHNKGLQGKSRDNFLFYLKYDPGFTWKYPMTEVIEIIQNKDYFINQKKPYLKILKDTLVEKYNLFKIHYWNIFKSNNSIILTKSRIRDIEFDSENLSYKGILNLRSSHASNEVHESISDIDLKWTSDVIEALLILDDLNQYHESIEFIKDNIKMIFPKIFSINNKNKKKLLKNYELINYGGDIFKNYVMLDLIYNEYHGKLSGAQHGGMYKYHCDFHLSMETSSYEHFYYMRTTPLVKENLTNRQKKMLLGFRNCRGILYPRNNKFVNHTSFMDSKYCDTIQQNADYLREELKSFHKNIWIKSHPRNKDEMDYKNCQVRAHRNLTKAGIDADTVSCVIFDTPGSSLEFYCIQRNIKYVYFFNPSWFDLSDYAKEHCSNKLSLGEIFYGEDSIVRLFNYLENIK